MFLYFIETGDAIKVGVASDVKARMNDIQVGNAEKIRLIHSEPLPKDKAHKMEKIIHGLFFTIRLNGEWFQSTEFLAKYIQNIKDNGIDTHYAWVEQRYNEIYSKAFEEISSIIRKDFIRSNPVLFNMFKKDVNYLIEPFDRVFDEGNITGPVKGWLQKLPLGRYFHLKTIYKDLGVSNRRHKQAISRVLSRLVKDKDMAQRVIGNGRFVRISST